ncbi:hypothetical protein EON63_00295 [archaeon]|nr:MAG: hypothetical protein EON63_00295 [archaeon]
MVLAYIRSVICQGKAAEEENSVKLLDSIHYDQSALPYPPSVQQCGALMTDAHQKRIEQLEDRIRKLERMVNDQKGIDTIEAISAQSFDRTLVNLAKAKDWVLTHAIPDTDPECKFDWHTLDCEPACRCSLHYKLGDYNFDRACRLKPKALQVDCQNFIRTPSPLAKSVKQTMNIIRNQTDLLAKQLDSVAPATDKECKWSWKKMKCVPSQFCTFEYVWGDYSLTRACRFRTDDLVDDD